MESVLARVATLELALSNPAALLSASAATGGTAAPSQGPEGAPEAATAPGGSSFAQALQSATANYSASAGGSTGASPSPALASVTSPAGLTGISPAGAPGAVAAGSGVDASGYPGAGSGIGARIVAIAESQAGQAEEPLGSNEGAAIAEYRTATAGAIPGAPWCAYFASWAARQAGEPLGANGEGLGAVSEIWSWAQSAGRAIPNGPGIVPRPGDLIVFGDEHVGIVKDVLPNGDIQTIEGNYENKVALNTRTPTEATGYVNME